jgi:hypothetical protein
MKGIKGSDDSLGITVTHHLDGQVSIPSKIKFISLLHRVKTGPGDYPASFPMGTGARFPADNAAGALSTYSVPSSAEVKNARAIPPLPIRLHGMVGQLYLFMKGIKSRFLFHTSEDPTISNHLITWDRRFLKSRLIGHEGSSCSLQPATRSSPEPAESHTRSHIPVAHSHVGLYVPDGDLTAGAIQLASVVQPCHVLLQPTSPLHLGQSVRRNF